MVVFMDLLLYGRAIRNGLGGGGEFLEELKAQKYLIHHLRSLCGRMFNSARVCVFVCVFVAACVSVCSEVRRYRLASIM